MGLTLLELKKEIRAGLGGRTDLDDRLTTFINLAQQRIARFHDFDEMETVATTLLHNTGSPNDRFVNLPNLREVYSLVVEDGLLSHKLVQLPQGEWDKKLPLPSQYPRGIPSHYVIWGYSVEVWPLPDKTYTLRMRWSRWPSDLMNDSDRSELREKDDIIIHFALAYSNSTLGKYDDAMAHERIAVSHLSEAIRADQVKPDLRLRGAPEDLSNRPLPAEAWRDPFVRS